jgi:hypothetical protein
MNLSNLGLTPGQLAEVEDAGSELVAAWLRATEARHGLKSPTGWFLAGVRSGELPDAPSDSDRANRIRLAELRIRDLWHELPSEAELLEEVFNRQGLLYAYDSPELRELMVSYWTTLVRAPVHFPASHVESANTGIRTSA